MKKGGSIAVVIICMVALAGMGLYFSHKYFRTCDCMKKATDNSKPTAGEIEQPTKPTLKPAVLPQAELEELLNKDTPQADSTAPTVTRPVLRTPEQLAMLFNTRSTN